MNLFTRYGTEPATGKRTVAKKPLYSTRWAMYGTGPDVTVEYGPLQEDFQGEKRVAAVYVDGEYVGWVYKNNYTAFRKIGRLRSDYGHNKAVEWHYGLGTLSLTGDHRSTAATKGDATERLVREYLAKKASD